MLKPKFDGLYRKDTVNGRVALEKLSTIKVGDVFEEVLFAAIPANIQWKCTSVEVSKWVFEGLFFGMPFCDVEVIANDISVAINSDITPNNSEDVIRLRAIYQIKS